MRLPGGYSRPSGTIAPAATTEPSPILAPGEDGGVHADEAAVTDLAAVYHRRVADDAVVPDGVSTDL